MVSGHDRRAARQRSHPRGRPARRLPERTRGDRDRRQGAADRRARPDGRQAARGNELRARGRDPAARRRARGPGADRRARRRRGLGADPQRARAGERPGAARSLPGDQRLPERERGPQPQERQPLDRGVADRAGDGSRPRPRGGAALRGRHQRELRLPVRGRRAAGARVRDRRAPARCRRAGDRLRRHHRDGQPAPGPGLLRARARGARRRRRADRALPQHPRPGAGERARRARDRVRVLRVELRRARGLPGATRRHRQHRHGRPRVDAPRDGRRNRHRPGGSAGRHARRGRGPRAPTRIAHARGGPSRVASRIGCGAMSSTIKKVGVLGAGLMGHGIAQVTAAAGYDVVLREVDDAALQKGIGKIEKQLAKAVEKGRSSQEDADAVLGRIHGTTDYADLADCDLVIEAITEDLALKREMWKEVDAIVKPEAVFATNTSSLAVIDQAASTSRPGQFVGLHYFNPAQVMKLVEVIRAVTTSDDAFDTAQSFAQAQGKLAIPTKDKAGFIVNRLLVPYMLDAMRAYEEGVGSVDEIDEAMKAGAGHPMGPLTLADFVGLDTLGSICDVLFDEFRERRFAQPPTLRKMLSAGWYGRKSGMGFYDYSGEEPVPNKGI